MKLTKQKLEQLIMEEYVRRIGDEGRPTNYPEYADKLTALAKSDPLQARELADALDEPLDIEYDPSNMKKMPFKRPGGAGVHGAMYNDKDHFLHFDFILDGGASSFSEEPDMQEVYEFAQRKGLDPEETYKKIMSNYKRVMFSTFINPPKTDYERNKEFKKQLEKQFGADFRSYREKYGN